MRVGRRTLIVKGLVSDYNLDSDALIRSNSGALMINLSDMNVPGTIRMRVEDFGGSAPRNHQLKFCKKAEKICDIIDESDKDTVLMFCNQGQQRSPALAAFYIKRKLGLSTQEAFSVVKKYRPEAFPEHHTYIF
jgi:predicted protein tyrosine phosphatase